MEYRLRTEGDESLYSKSTKWDFSEPPHVSGAIEEAISGLMLQQGGIGFAANQMGLLYRVFAINTRADGSMTRFYYNPVILVAGDTMVSMEEGCLSFPGLRLQINRPEMILASWQNGAGETHTDKLTGLQARVFQHELDHLDGVCFTNLTSRLKLSMAKKRLAKRKRNQ